MVVNWGEDPATALARAYGAIDGNASATGGVFSNWLASGNPLAGRAQADIDRIQSGGVTEDELVNMLVDAELAAQQADPSYGSLAKPPYETFKPYGQEAPQYEEFKLSDFMADPGYQFRVDEGNKAIDRASAARGGFYSGGALKEATRYGSDLASQEFDNAYRRHVTDYQNKSAGQGNAFNQYNQNFGIGYGQAKGDSDTLFNRLTSLTQTGTGATNTAVNANQNNANAMGNIYGQVGNAQAAGALSQGNILSGSLSQILGGGRSSYGGSNIPVPAGPKVTTTGPLPWL